MFISLDLETTGFYPEKDKIIEFGAVKFDLNGQIETMQFLVNPEKELPEIVKHITKIKDEDLIDAPLWEEKKEEVQNFIQDFPIIGHNIKFDTAFLRANGIELTNPEFDTQTLSTILLHKLPSYSLEIISNLFNLKHQDKHRALDDAIAAMELFQELRKKYQSLDPKLIEKFKKLCERSEWTMKSFFLGLESKNEYSKIIDLSKIKQESQQEDKKEAEEKAKEINETKAASIFEITPPYTELIKNLTKTADKGTYIALSDDLFHRASQELDQNVAKLDISKNYLSPARLKKFEEKEKFEDHEISAILKYITWSKETETGLLSELALYGEERKSNHKVNADPLLTDIESEPFIKKAIETDKKSAAICSHNYIIENKEKIKKLIIIDIDKFTKTLYFNESIFLSIETATNPLQELKEIYKDNENIETLINKCTILFGILGIIYEKYNDGSQYTERSTLDHISKRSQEWEDIGSLISQLINLSKILAEIKEEKSEGHLQNWKEVLKKMDEIFRTTDLEKNLIIIEKDQNQNPYIKSLPYSTKEKMDEILNNCENYQIINESVDVLDKGTFIKRISNLPTDLPIIKDEKTEEDLEIIISGEDIEENLINKIAAITEIKGGKIAIIINSKKQIENYTLKLSQKLKNTLIASQSTGSIGKLTEQFKTDPENSIIIVTPQGWEKFEEHHLIDTLFIPQLPFSPPSDPFIMSQSRNLVNDFMEFQIPQTITTLTNTINRLKTNKTNHKQVFILDSRIQSKRYGKFIIDNLRNRATTKIVNPASLLSNVKSNQY